MNGVIQTHQEEVIALQQTVSSKQQAISETESNLTAIGTYVDKLEERLTSFAVTRRDMEERERVCKEIEESAIKTEAAKKELEVQVEHHVDRADPGHEQHHRAEEHAQRREHAHLPLVRAAAGL